jgi:hypothetical protein
LPLSTSLNNSYGGPDANSYVDVTEATQVNSLYAYDPTIWNSATAPQQIAALLQATREIDAAFRWRGDRLFYNQRLEFPRTDDYGEPWPWNTLTTVFNTFNVFQTQMKDAVQMATALQAFEILRRAGKTTFADLQAQGVQSYSESVKNLSESYTFSGKTSMGGLYAEPLTYLTPYKGQRRIFRA